MAEMESERQKALKKRCNEIIMSHQEAICMAVIELDCGCTNVCGVSFTGAPVGPVETLSGSWWEEEDDPPVCIQCAGAGKPLKDRIVRQGLIWPGDENEVPDIELRNLIGREVFGPDYSESDD